MRRLAIVLAITGCGKELNPAFCRAHPEDDRCQVVTADAVVDGVTSDASVTCPASYVTVSGQSSRYRVVDSADDWTSAAATCANDGVAVGARTHLVVLSNAAELAALGPLMNPYRFVGHSERDTSGVWLAVTDEPNVYPELVAGAAPPFASGYPNGSGDCMVMAQASLAVYDANCSSDISFVCECDAYANDPNNY